MCEPVKPPTKPFVPTIPTSVSQISRIVVRAVEHHDPGLLEHGGHLVGARRVVVVVAEHGDHRDAEVAHGVGEDRGLLGLAVRGEVAGQQDQVDAALERGERLTGALAVAVAAEVHVAGRRDADPALVLAARRAVRGVYRHPWWRVPTRRWP